MFVVLIILSVFPFSTFLNQSYKEVIYRYFQRTSFFITYFFLVSSDFFQCVVCVFFLVLCV